MKSILRRTLVIVAKAVILLPCCAICIWWAYSISKAVGGGVYTLSQALSLVFEMSTITTALTGVVWLLSPLLHKQQSWVGLAAKTAAETALILAFYTAAVFSWRQQWTPEKGMSEEAAFIPIVGHVNAQFFSDFLWLEYLICVVPVVAILSGIATSSFDFLQRQRQLRRQVRQV